LSSAQEADFQPVVEPFDSACEEGSAGLTEHEGHAGESLGKGRSTVHHPFDELDFRHLTFDLSIFTL
jgi:hypothetical protein